MPQPLALKMQNALATRINSSVEPSDPHDQLVEGQVLLVKVFERDCLGNPTDGAAGIRGLIPEPATVSSLTVMSWLHCKISYS